MSWRAEGSARIRRSIVDRLDLAVAAKRHHVLARTRPFRGRNTRETLNAGFPAQSIRMLTGSRSGRSLLLEIVRPTINTSRTSPIPRNGIADPSADRVEERCTPSGQASLEARGQVGTRWSRQASAPSCPVTTAHFPVRRRCRRLSCPQACRAGRRNCRQSRRRTSQRGLPGIGRPNISIAQYAVRPGELSAVATRSRRSPGRGQKVFRFAMAYSCHQAVR